MSRVPAVVQHAADPLRIADLVPLRRMLGTDSLVIRVNPDRTFTRFERMPALFFDQSIRHVLSPDAHVAFEEACAQAIEQRVPLSYRPAGLHAADEVMINPIMDNDGDACRFLVCWSRRAGVFPTSHTSLGWEDLRLDRVVVRYRAVLEGDTQVVEASPWWALERDEVLELWPHHTHVSAMGLGHAVIESLIYDAAEAAAEHGGGPAVRISVPSADMLAGLVPVVHAGIRASGLVATRFVLAVPVELAVDPDLLPIIVHLRAMGSQIDLVGLDALTASLHRVSTTSGHAHPLPVPQQAQTGAWVDTFAQAIASPVS